MTKSEWKESSEILNNREPMLEETKLAQDNSEFNTVDDTSSQIQMQSKKTVTYTQFQEASRLLNGQEANIDEVIAAVKDGNLPSEALSGVDVPLEEWINLQEAFNGVKPSVTDVVVRKEFVEKNTRLHLNNFINDERVGKVLEKAKGLTSQASQATQSVLNDVRRDGKFAVLSNKKNLYRLQSLLIIIVVILIIVTMFSGDNYVTYNGNGYNIVETYEYGFQDTHKAHLEFIGYFILLGMVLVVDLLGMVRRKWITSLSVVGILAAAYFIYSFNIVHKQVLEQFPVTGFNYSVPYFLGYVLVALFIWMIAARWQEKHGLQK